MAASRVSACKIFMRDSLFHSTGHVFKPTQPSHLVQINQQLRPGETNVALHKKPQREHLHLTKMS